MSKLLTKQQATDLAFLTEINDGFRLPDQAYIHGTEVGVMQYLGGDAYHSNYWYGPREDALTFAEELANYFKTAYDLLGSSHELGKVDLQGLVLYWENGDNAMVGNINIDGRLVFRQYKSGLPEALRKPDALRQIMTDRKDNSPHTVNINKLSQAEQQGFVDLVAPDYQAAYLQLLS